MPVPAEIEAFAEDLRQWRRDIHAHPETAFKETRTAAFVAEKLNAFGLEVHTGLAGTGVVGVLRGSGGRTVGLRADMDALFIDERTNLPYASKNAGRMHACGHDGHTVMLLGAARHLAENPPAGGDVVFIFQPAEEGEGGARVMVDDGLFEKFPVEAVFGLHNWPGLPPGRFGVKAGAMMAAFAVFEATLTGTSAHAAMPHQGRDPVVAAAQLVSAWQTIASRNADPLDTAVVSVTQISGGETWNIIPDEVVVRGTVRYFDDAVRDLVEDRMTEIADGICQAFGLTHDLSFDRRYPATINEEKATQLAAQAAQAVVGAEAVETIDRPSMGAEDFAFMLRENPGSYIWLGNGGGDDGRTLHNSRYDFNDDILTTGAAYWVALAETFLGSGLPSDREGTDE